MRKHIAMLILAVMGIALTTGCQKEKSLDIKGCWSLVSSSQITSTVPEVLMEFKADGTFDLFQRADRNSSFKHFSGRWTLGGKKLSGTYSDGTTWASDYSVSIEDGFLTLSSGEQNDVYRGIDSIPEDIHVIPDSE
jgi:hypothetical protein